MVLVTSGLFSKTFLHLFSMMNPLGLAMVFISMTRHLSAEERHRSAYLVAVYSILLLLITLFAGPAILDFFGITLPYISIAGGCLVFHSAWAMLNPTHIDTQGQVHDDIDPKQMAFFPLTMPLTAGAGAIAIVISLTTSLPHRYAVFWAYGEIAAGIVLVCVLVGICYRYADEISKHLGKTGSSVVTDIFAFVLLCIAVGMIWHGVQPLGKLMIC